MPQPQKPKAKPSSTVQLGRRPRALPASTMPPEQADRARLARQLDRVDKLKQQHAAELAAKNAEIARIKADSRHDRLIELAAEAATAGKLTAAQQQTLQNRLLNEHQRYAAPLDANGKPVPFPVREVLARLLDALHKETGGAAGVPDVRKMNHQEYQEHLRRRGLHNPALGYHNPV